MPTACHTLPHRPSRSSIGQGPARSRRRQIDPTTCERDYQPEELEFMRALEQYKRTSGACFPPAARCWKWFAGWGMCDFLPVNPADSSRGMRGMGGMGLVRAG